MKISYLKLLDFYLFLLYNIFGVINMEVKECCYHLKGSDGFVGKTHIHNDIEMIHIINGDGTVIKNNITYPMKSGYVYFIDARKSHIVYPVEFDEYIRNKIVIDADLFFDFCDKHGITDSVQNLFNGPPSKEKGGKLNNLFKTVFELLNSNEEENKGFVIAYILEILHISISTVDMEESYHIDGIMQKIFNIISETHGCVTLDELSDALRYSKFYLCHLFRERTGLTISEYSDDKKYETALELLLETEKSIWEISEACGFNNQSSFTRFFKRKSGMSPLAFRKDKGRML